MTTIANHCPQCGVPIEGGPCSLCGAAPIALPLVDGTGDFPHEVEPSTDSELDWGAAEGAPLSAPELVNQTLAAVHAQNIRHRDTPEGPAVVALVQRIAVVIRMQLSGSLITVEIPVSRLPETQYVGAMRLALELSAARRSAARYSVRGDLLLLRFADTAENVGTRGMQRIVLAMVEEASDDSRLLATSVMARVVTREEHAQLDVDWLPEAPQLQFDRVIEDAATVDAGTALEQSKATGMSGMFQSVAPLMTGTAPAASPSTPSLTPSAPAAPPLPPQKKATAPTSAIPDTPKVAPGPTPAARPVVPPAIKKAEEPAKTPGVPPPLPPRAGAAPVANSKPTAQYPKVAPPLPAAASTSPAASPPAAGRAGKVTPVAVPQVKLDETAEFAVPAMPSSAVPSSPRRQSPAPATKVSVKAEPAKVETKPTSDAAKSGTPAVHRPHTVSVSTTSKSPAEGLVALLHRAQTLGAVLSFADQPASMTLFVRAAVYQAIFEFDATMPAAVGFLFQETTSVIKEIYITAPGIRRGAMQIPSTGPAFEVMQKLVDAGGQVKAGSVVQVQPITTLQEAKQHLARYVSEIDQAPKDTDLRHFLALGALCELLVRAKLPGPTQDRLRGIISHAAGDGPNPQNVELMMTALNRMIA